MNFEVTDLWSCEDLEMSTMSSWDDRSALLNVETYSWILNNHSVYAPHNSLLTKLIKLSKAGIPLHVRNTRYDDQQWYAWRYGRTV